jgi:hypothetical protein
MLYIRYEGSIDIKKKVKKSWYPFCKGKFVPVLLNKCPNY